MSKITGLGAAFFNINGDHNKLLEWYHKTLGLEVTEYGINIDSTQKTLVTLKRDNINAFINFTVDNIEDFMKEMISKNVEVVQEIKDYGYGKFSQIKDSFGNIIELFEINPEAYEKMISEEMESYESKHK